MDTSRFCLFKCKPTAPVAVGNICERLSREENAEMENDDGNGRDAGLLDPETAQVESASLAAAPSAASSDAPAPAPAAAPEEETKMETEKLRAEVKYDYRKVVAQRLRAEAGAAMAHGAYASERVRRNMFMVERDAKITAKVATAIAPMNAAIEDAIATVDGNATAAKTSQQTAAKSLAEAKVVAQNFRQTTRELAITEIKKQAAAAAKEEAKVWAQMNDYDKPDFWNKVLAVRAADPYMAAMTAAVQRTDEYNSYAKGLVGQARSAQAEAQSRNSEASALEAQGDKIGAVAERNYIRKLLGRANALEAQAKGFYGTAQQVRLTIPEWQNAGSKAAARIAWEYKMLHTPMPSAM